MNSIVIAKNIYKTFGSTRALENVSLELKPGVNALLGPNGAGKTTLVEILEGLCTPDQGEVTIFGKSYATERRTIYASIGVVLQETRLYKKFTVKETLELFASFYGSSMPINELIDLLELSDKANCRLEHLSGGQRQRTYLGCALVNQPKLLFLDEPTTGLDPQSRRSVWHLLKRIQATGCCIVLTTHYMDEAEFLADQVYILDHGKIISHGTPGELIAQHGQPPSLKERQLSGHLENVFLNLTGRTLRDA